MAQAQQAAAVESHQERGLRLLQDERNFAAAIPELEQAYRESPNPGLLLPLAQAYFQLGNCQRAQDLYNKFLQAVPDAPISARIIAQRDLAACEEMLKAKSPPPTPAVPLEITTNAAQGDTPGPELNRKDSSLPPRTKEPSSVAQVASTVQTKKNPPVRPIWRLAIGASAIGAGLLVGGFGVGALAVDGNRVEPMGGLPAGTLQTTGVGAGLLVSGLLLAAGGAVLIAIP